MIMSLFKKRRYYFTDSSFASDTIIADCMGGIALIIEVVSVIVSIATAGHVPEVFGLLYIIAMLLSIVGDLCTHGFTVPEGRRAWQADLHLAEHRILCGSGHNHFIRQILKSSDEVGGNYERRRFAGAYAACDRTNQ